MAIFNQLEIFIHLLKINQVMPQTSDWVHLEWTYLHGMIITYLTSTHKLANQVVSMKGLEKNRF